MSRAAARTRLGLGLLAAMLLTSASTRAHSPYLLPNAFDVVDRKHVTVEGSFTETFFVPDVAMKADDYHVIAPDGCSSAAEARLSAGCHRARGADARRRARIASRRARAAARQRRSIATATGSSSSRAGQLCLLTRASDDADERPRQPMSMSHVASRWIPPRAA